MHKEWVKTGAFIDPPEGVRRRFVSDYDADGAYESAYWEHEADVPDDTDEPEADGVYTDTDGDYWVKLNGKWRNPDDITYISTWDNVSEYGPFAVADDY